MNINNPGSSGRTHVRQDSQPAQHKRKKKNHYRAAPYNTTILKVNAGKTNQVCLQY